MSYIYLENKRHLHNVAKLIGVDRQTDSASLFPLSLFTQLSKFPFNGVCHNCSTSDHRPIELFDLDLIKEDYCGWQYNPRWKNMEFKRKISKLLSTFIESAWTSYLSSLFFYFTLLQIRIELTGSSAMKRNGE